jgi:DNA-binding winged helix-turn-helix (wHTH) protein/TolB-like protein/Tfp pilus assembly protein PilF
MTTERIHSRSAPTAFGVYRLDPAERRLFRGDDLVHLQNKTFDLLVALVDHAGHVVGKEALLEAVWPNAFIEEGVLTVHVAMLRKVFGDDGYIETVPKVGYRFVAPVGPWGAAARSLPALEISATTEAAPAPEIPVPPVAVRRSHRARIALAMAVVIVAAGAWYSWRSREVVPKPPASLAVLPFALLNPDPQASHLEVGMADAIITRLASSRGFRIPPTVVIRRYADHARAPLDVGRELDVDAVLTGTLQRSDGRLRVTVQVMRVDSGEHIWAGRFDEPIGGIFSMQDAISEQLAERLVLDVPQARAGWRRETANVEAYEYYLLGRESWARRSPVSIRAGIDMLRKAIELDPSFAGAYAGIADSYSLTASGMRAQDRFPLAKTAALKALELDDSLAEAHNALAFISYKWEWQWATTDREFRRAIDLDPSYVLARQWYGEYLSIIGRHDEALKELRHAAALDRFSTAIKVDIAAALGRAGRPEEAIKVFQEAAALDPNAAAPHSGLWNAYRTLGREDEAFEALVRFRTLGGAADAEISALRAAYQRAGATAVLESDLKVLLAADARGESRALNLTSLASTIARTYAMLGDRDRALTWLEEACRRRDDGPLTTRTAWYWKSYQQDARFQAIERLVAMPEPAS